MPIKIDESGRRRVEMELLLPGTPEQVWEAVATARGNAAWFTRAEIEEKVGGALRFDFGSMGSSTGEVTAYEPPRRFAYVERDWMEGAPSIDTEITLTPRGDRCLVRMVHSLVASSEQWDAQMESFEENWPGFFAVLRMYLRHFAGRKSTLMHALSSSEQGAAQVWKRCVQALGLAAPNVGERIETPAGSGAVERVYQDLEKQWLLVRLETGILMLGTCPVGGRTHVNLSFYCYDEPASQLQAWLQGVVA